MVEAQAPTLPIANARDGMAAQFDLERVGHLGADNAHRAPGRARAKRVGIEKRQPGALFDQGKCDRSACGTAADHGDMDLGSHGLGSFGLMSGGARDVGKRILDRGKDLSGVLAGHRRGKGGEAIARRQHAPVEQAAVEGLQPCLLFGIDVAVVGDRPGGEMHLEQRSQPDAALRQAVPARRWCRRAGSCPDRPDGQRPRASAPASRQGPREL